MDRLAVRSHIRPTGGRPSGVHRGMQGLLLQDRNHQPESSFVVKPRPQRNSPLEVLLVPTFFSYRILPSYQPSVASLWQVWRECAVSY